jgi:hypothetical protein
VTVNLTQDPAAETLESLTLLLPIVNLGSAFPKSEILTTVIFGIDRNFVYRASEMTEICTSERNLRKKMDTRLEVFRILSERYRNRGKRFDLRCNLIAALYNHYLKVMA